jgi:hypothetical protein
MTGLRRCTTGPKATVDLAGVKECIVQNNAIEKAYMVNY